MRHVIFFSQIENARFLNNIFHSPGSNGILVENVDGNLVDHVLLLFENKSKSGGGPISNYQFDASERILEIIYECETTKQSALDFGPIRFLDNVYMATDRVKKAATVVKHTRLDSNDFPYTLIIKDPCLFDNFKSYLTKHKAKLTIEPKTNNGYDGDGNFLEIQFYGRHDILKEYEVKFGAYEWVIDTTLINIVRDKLVKYYSSYEHFNLVIQDANDVKGRMTKLYIEGFKDTVNIEKTKINAIISDESLRKKTSKTMRIDNETLGRLIGKTKLFSTYTNNKTLDIHMHPDNNQIEVTGYDKYVCDFNYDFNSLIDTINTKSFPIDRYTADYLIKAYNDMVDMVQKKTNNIQFEYKVHMNSYNNNVNSIDLIIYAVTTSLDCIDQIHGHIKSNVSLFEYKINTDDKHVEQTLGIYEQFLRTLQTELATSNESNAVIFYLNRHEKCVRCVGDVYVVKVVGQKIRNFFDSNTLFTYKLDKLSRVDVKFLKLVVKDIELNNVCSKLTKQHNCSTFKIDYRFLNANVNHDNDLELEVKTTRKLYEKFLVEVNSLLVAFKKHTDHMHVPNLSKQVFLELDNIRNSIYSVEKSCECLIMLDDCTKSDTETSNRDLQIVLEVGSVFDPKYKTDAIVITTSPDLNLTNGTVSKQLLTIAGNYVQTQLKQNYPNGLDPSRADRSIAITTGGQLKHLKHIFHVCLQNWNPNDETRLEIQFRRSIHELLRLVDANQCKNIAIPAIGCGILNYPKQKVPKWMYESIKTYYDANVNATGIGRVVVVLHENDKDTVKCFKDYESTRKTKPTQLVQSGPGSSQILCSDLTGNIKDGFRLDLDKIQICVFIGDIVKQDCDVIVNPTNKDLSMSGRVSQLLLATDSSGTIRNELIAANVIDGVLFTSSGSLKCKRVLHVDVNSGASICETVLNTLIAFNDRKVDKYILYPVIGTGTLTHDVNQVVREMLFAITLFTTNCFHRHIPLSVERVGICVYEKQSFILDMFHGQMKDLARKFISSQTSDIKTDFKAFGRTRNFIDAKTVNGVAINVADKL
jgi:O-acetyl-ADP-ribose deacetylase (regulator of RNase III)